MSENIRDTKAPASEPAAEKTGKTPLPDETIESVSGGITENTAKPHEAKLLEVDGFIRA